MGSIAKAIAAFFTTLGTWGGTAFADGHLSAVEAFGLCGVVVATAAVWQVTNTAPVVPPPLPVLKKAKSSKGQIDLGTAIVIAVLLILVFAVVFGVPNR